MNFEFNSDDMVLLVIDIQERLAIAMEELDQSQVSRNVSILLELANLYSFPVEAI